MRIEVDVRGLDKVIGEMRRVPQAVRGVGEVYMAGERNQNLAEYHALGTVSMPARNVFFLPPAKLKQIGRIMSQGIKDVQQGRSSGLMQATGDAAKTAALAFQSNIDRGQTDKGKIAPLSKDYKEWKDAKWGKRPILVASGQFYRAIKWRVVKES